MSAVHRHPPGMIRSIAVLLFACACSSAGAAGPSYNAPGVLEKNSGKGLVDKNVYYPHILFPLENAPAYLNSQVYRPGGNKSIVAGGQCDSVNYTYPWVDNFCESRGWDMPMCPGGTGHQGQDIRPASCKKNLHWAVAVEDGIVSHIGSYSVTLQARSGTLYRYLHLGMKGLRVKLLDDVKQGDKIGQVSSDFGDASTTIHLHFDIKDAVKGNKGKGMVYMPPYMSLQASYKRLLAVQP
ncbi:MAG: M23 family metallopeptidase [Telluria sp.]